MSERGKRLKGTHGQAGDFLEMAKVAGEHRIALLDCSDGDHQIVEAQHVSFGRLLALDLSHKPCGLIGHRVDWNKAYQLLNVLAPTLGRVTVLAR